jgi:hypothetical protein
VFYGTYCLWQHRQTRCRCGLSCLQCCNAQTQSTHRCHLLQAGALPSDYLAYQSMPAAGCRIRGCIASWLSLGSYHTMSSCAQQSAALQTALARKLLPLYKTCSTIPAGNCVHF